MKQDKYISITKSLTLDFVLPKTSHQEQTVRQKKRGVREGESNHDQSLITTHKKAASQLKQLSTHQAQSHGVKSNIEFQLPCKA